MDVIPFESESSQGLFPVSSMEFSLASVTSDLLWLANLILLLGLCKIAL